MQQLTRRDFVKSTATLAGASVVAASHTDSLFAGKKKVTQQNLPICDTHLHLWDLTKFKLPWLSGDGVKRINRSFVMKDYRAASDGHNVARAVYMEVNVAGSDQVGEAEYVIDLCKRDDNPMADAFDVGTAADSIDVGFEVG